MTPSRGRDHGEPRYTVRLTARAGDWVKGRTRRSGGRSVARQVASDIETLAEILASEARRLPLTLGETRLLRDTVAPIAPSGGAGRLLFGALLDTIDIATESGVDTAARYGADPDALARKVRTLGVAADVAVRDALADWRVRNLPDTVDGYRAAGLNVIELEHEEEPT